MEGSKNPAMQSNMDAAYHLLTVVEFHFIFANFCIWEPITARQPPPGVNDYQLPGVSYLFLITFAAMVSKSFDINVAAIQPFDSSAKKLLIELSSDAVTVILWDRQAKHPDAIESFHGSHRTTADWETMVQQSRLLSLTDLETLVLVGYGNMIPVPASLYDPQLAASQLELFFGNSRDLFTSGDVLKELEMVLAWQIPLEEQNFIVNHFQWVQVKHAVSLLLEHHQVLSSLEGHILIYANESWILFWQEGEFRLAKPVLFSKPDDLSWHLLNTCRVLEKEPTAINWQVSGMVEEGSSLWLAISKFLDPVIPMQSDISMEDVPQHYFAHIFNSI
jgi:hypothetical protein